ncbi:MAG: ATP-binding protein [Microscillaceae bacterium]|nr:ATP-binding protein [Microscillaceae bacterium]
MRLIGIIVGLMCICVKSTLAQEGDFFLYSYNSPISNTDNQNLAALQGDNGNMYFANTKGLITYDGVQWKIISTLSTPYSLAKNESGTIYVGCRENFGYLDEDIFGRTIYKSISPANKDFGEITQVCSAKDKIYFYTDRIIFCVSEKSKKIENYWMASKSNFFAGMFVHKNQAFVNIEGRGIHRLEYDQPDKIEGGELFAEKVINTSFLFSDAREITLIGTEDNLLYLFDGQKFKPYAIEAQKYLEESILSGGLDLSQDEFVLSTFSGGCILVRKSDGHTLQMINYQTGLSDDEVLAICKDSYGGLWICNDYGITRADVQLPIRNYSDYPGIEGEITSVTSLDSTLYVATSEGVFYLAKVDKFSQIVKLIRKEKKELRIVERNIQTTIQLQQNNREEQSPLNSKLQETIAQIQSDESISEKKKKRLEKKLNRQTKRETRRNQAEDESPEEILNPLKPPISNTDTLAVETKIEESPVNESESTKTITQYVDTPVKETYALQSIPFIYNKIEGINIKCRQLFVFQDRVLVASNQGMYEIFSNTSSRPIIKDAYIHFIYQSPQNPMRFYVATQSGIISILFEENTWRITNRSENIKQDIHAIEQLGDTLWLSGESNFYRILLDSSGNPNHLETFDLPNDYLENAVIRLIDQKPVFILSTGFYAFDAKTKTLVEDKKLEKFFNPRSEVIFLQQDYTWIKPLDASWRDLQNKSKLPANQTVYLSFFNDIKDIYVDVNKNIWVVADNALFKIQSDARLDLEKRFKIAISGIQHKKSDLPLKNLKLPYKNNSLKFQIAPAYFLREGDIQYQYRLEGLQDEWSEWDKESDIFAILPSGKYKLQVRAKNIFGQKSEETELKFEIKQPFWETGWFYLLMGIFAISIVYLIIKLRTRALSIANQKLEIKVSEKTQEISEQKKQLEVAFHEISEQKNQIQIANQELKKVNVTLEQKVEERTAKLKSTLLQLLETNRELDTFIYRSSHDLKGPISRLIGLVNLAKMEDDQDSIYKNLNLIHFTAHRMSKMLDKLMNVHAINSESIEYERFNIHKFLEDIRARLRDVPGEESAYIIFKVDAETSMVSDKTLLGIIIENLLENAIQFQNPSSDVFSIIKLEIKTDEEFIRLKVTDNGAGIGESHKDKIFDMFYRGSELSKGNGLGLYLVKKATEKLNGQIHFKSEPGNITSFTVILPHEKVRLKEPETIEKGV